MVKDNNSEALLRLGDIYNYGLCVKKNISQSIYYYELSAKLNNSEACNKLIHIYYENNGIERNHLKVTQYLEKAIKLNNSESLYFKATLCEKGDGVPQDYTEAIKYYKLAAINHNTDACIRLSEIYSNGIIVDVDLDQAIKYLKSIINLNRYKYYEDLIGKNGNLYVAYNNLGLIYYTEFHDNKKAFELIKKSAYNEYPFAQSNYGLMLYLYSKDIENAKYYFKKSSKKNFAVADYNLAYIYEKEGDIKKANEHYMKASNEANDPIIYRNPNLNDERYELSKKFIICLTNLKLLEYYLPEHDKNLLKQLFTDAISILKIDGHDFSIKIEASIQNEKIKNNKLFSCLRTFIFGFLEFDFSGNQSQKIQINNDVKELNENSRPITNSVIDITEKTKFTKDKIKTENDLHFCNLNEDESKGNDMFDNPSDLFDFVFQKDEYWASFIQQIREIIEEMYRVLYTPPYFILFGRIKIPKSLKKKSQNVNAIDINQAFYEGFEFI